MKRILTICLTLAIAFVTTAGLSKAQAACVVTNVGGLTGYLHVAGCATGETVTEKRFKGTAPAGVTTNEGCIGYSQNLTSTAVANGDYTPGPGPGQCEQIDIGSNGVARYGGASKVCGDTCTTSAECKNPSANGAPVACVAGKCANTACAAGMTIPGANCSCGANTRRCGQTCSGALGLCGPGQGTCTYVNTNGPYCPWGWSQTYCAGSSNGYKVTACTSGDTGGGYLVGPNGKVSGLTVAEITASCSICGNGTVEGTEQCDMGANNGKPGYPCSATCTLPTPSPVVTPSPTPTPSALICDLTPTFTSTGSVSAWKYGDMITFSVGAVPSTRIPSGGSARYEGQASAYRGTTLVKTITLVPINATASQFQAMKVDVANSTYYFRFRYCVKTSAGIETCSNWGVWAVPMVGDPTPPPTTKTVKIVKDATTGWMDIDAINENGALVQQNSTRFTYSGTWQTDTSTVYSGGTSTYSGTAGASVTFTTSSPSVKLLTTRASNRATFDVFVNGVKKATLSTVNATRQDQYTIDLSSYLQ